MISPWFGYYENIIREPFNNEIMFKQKKII